MKEYRVDLICPDGVKYSELFVTKKEARSFYSAYVVPHLCSMELWRYYPPVKVVMGHVVRMGWVKVESKIGAEEFC
jgi:hypothetical protein